MKPHLIWSVGKPRAGTSRDHGYRTVDHNRLAPNCRRTIPCHPATLPHPPGFGRSVRFRSEAETFSTGESPLSPGLKFEVWRVLVTFVDRPLALMA